MVKAVRWERGRGRGGGGGREGGGTYTSIPSSCKTPLKQAVSSGGKTLDSCFSPSLGPFNEIQ
jgi:hypothetical protein